MIPSTTNKEDGTIIEFLNGSHSFDGLWFGDRDTTGSNFWWRKPLQEYLNQFKEQTVGLRWVKASERLSQHMVRVCCRRAGTLEGWFTGYYDFSRKVYMATIYGPHGVKPENIEWLEETTHTPVQEEKERGIIFSTDTPVTSTEYTGCIAHGKCKDCVNCIYPKCMSKELLQAEQHYNDFRLKSGTSLPHLQKMLALIESFHSGWFDGVDQKDIQEAQTYLQSQK